MNNKGVIREQQHSITLQAKVFVPSYLKVMLLLFFILAAVLTVGTMNRVAGDSVKTLLGVTALGGALLFFCGRYILWNIAGSETITVSTQSILYSRKYGVINPPAKIILFRYLAMNVEAVKEEETVTWGVINFYDRHKQTSQLQHIFSSAVYLPTDQLTALQQKLQALFERQDAGYGLSFSLN